MNQTLTKQIKDEIVEALLKHRFAELERKVRDQSFDAVRAAREALIGKDGVALIDGAPDGFFPVISSRTNLVVAGRYQTLYWDSRKVRIPFRYHNGTIYLDRENHAEVCDLVEAAHETYRDLEKAKNEAALKARSVLDSVRTVAKLLEVWPEVETLVPAHAKIPKIKGSVPAMLIATLNASFGLPPDVPAVAAE